MITLTTEQKNKVLASMVNQLQASQDVLMDANHQDLQARPDLDIVLRDRLIMNKAKVDSMIQSIQEILAKPDPINAEIDHFKPKNGLKISNRTAPFGTIMIIYESRPDVTIEAAALAFKAGNKIILKGGKEALHSNLALVTCWKNALRENDLDDTWITYLNLDRHETQQYFIDHASEIDLMVPRGGDGLIAFVKKYAQCPVLVSGRGNNFLFIDEDADLTMATNIVLNAKLSKISACNALDKVLIHSDLEGRVPFGESLIKTLQKKGCRVYGGDAFQQMADSPLKDDLWEEEFLDYKIAIATIKNVDDAIDKINRYSGGHSATIITKNETTASRFMQSVDVAAVYHNASTRFTDGGQFGMGGELAISTDKMHHRGPLGLEQLVTNKYYVYGNGQIR